MRDDVRQTRSHLIELFEQHGLHPRTMFGQNFLIDLNVIDSIVRAADLSPADVVLEVGAGTGSMTTSLSTWAGRVVSVEIDRDMYALATEAVAKRTNVRLLNQDALKSKNTLAPEVIDAVRSGLREVSKQLGRPPRLKLVSNLPYSVATPVVSNLIATDLPWERMVMTIQYELGLRMAAKPSTSNYGALGVWCQAHGRVEILRKLGPKVFWPRPGVDSAVVRIIRDKSRVRRMKDRAFFHDYARRVFQNRRKTLRSVLSAMVRKQLSKPQVDAFLAANDLTETSRADTLDVATHIRIANALQRRLADDGEQPATPPSEAIEADTDAGDAGPSDAATARPADPED